MGGDLTRTMNLRVVSSTGPDYYPTPAWAIRGLLAIEKFVGPIHEPCCGAGHLSKALEAAGYTVTSSDLFDHGYGESGLDVRSLTGVIENIVTNPPYNLATEILPHMIRVTQRKVALLTRMAFLESKRRFPIFKEFPPAAIHVFSERLSMSPAGEDVQGGGTVSHCWIIWDKACNGPTTLKWIPPGYKVKGLL